MTKLFFAVLVLCCLTFTLEKNTICSGYHLDLKYNNKSIYIDSLYIPKIDSSEKLIRHYAYCLVYDETHEQAKWISYTLSKKRLNGPFKRANNFKKDPLVLSGSATHSDYKGSGYDRGHLAPAADMTWSDRAMNESFYYSNMSPQSPSFNRGIWKKLESRVRKWVLDFDSIYVTTGPILEPNLPSIGNGLSVPASYYKSLIGFKDGTSTAIAFLLPNEGSKSNLKDFVISIDSLENYSDLDFNSELEKSLQDNLEDSICMSCWKWQ